MPTTTAIAGMCHICQQTVAGHRIRRHLSRCIPARVGLTMVQDPLSHISQRTAHISIRAPGKPHWLELGVRCDVTLRELDKFLRSAWLECCGHLSHFLIDDVIYSVMVPMPWEDRYFEPEYEGEENWRHMGEIIDSMIAPLTKFEYEFDYGATTELELECLAVLGDLVGQVSPKQPWHGGKIVILGQNHSQQTCLKCQQPALWKLVAEYDEDEVFDYELYEAEQVLYEDDLDPITFVRSAHRPRGIHPAGQLTPGRGQLLRQHPFLGDLVTAGISPRLTKNPSRRNGDRYGQAWKSTSTAGPARIRASTGQQSVYCFGVEYREVV